MQMLLPMDDFARAIEIQDAAAAKPRDYPIDPSTYDTVIVAFSGGKDSVACVLRLLEMGIKPELWHHDVDGGQDPHPNGLLWDWPVTHPYVRAFAAAFDLPVYFSWRVGGITGEVLKENDRTKPVRFEQPDGTIGQAGGIAGIIGTRLRWPAVSPSLSIRWCSALVKVDTMAAAIAGQERFKGSRVLVVTGERAQESSNRAKYATSEPHRNHQPGPIARRHVDHWRPILDWDEAKVWAIIEKHKVQPHPAYEIGLGRQSCALCIFMNDDDLAIVDAVAPERIDEMSAMEQQLGHTVKRDKRRVDEHARCGAKAVVDPFWKKAAMSHEFTLPMIVEQWTLPPGAFKRGGGPV